MILDFMSFKLIQHWWGCLGTICRTPSLNYAFILSNFVDSPCYRGPHDLTSRIIPNILFIHANFMAKVPPLKLHTFTRHHRCVFYDWYQQQYTGTPISLLILYLHVLRVLLWAIEVWGRSSGWGVFEFHWKFSSFYKKDWLLHKRHWFHLSKFTIFGFFSFTNSCLPISWKSKFAMVRILQWRNFASSEPKIS